MSYAAHTHPFFLHYNNIAAFNMFEYQILYYLRFSPPEVSSHFKSVARLEHEEKLVLTRRAEEWAVPRNRNNYGFLCQFF